MDKFLAKELNQIAKVDLYTHNDGCHHCEPFDCRACGLRIGYDSGPIGSKWAKVYVEAEEPIKEEWRDAFIDELTVSDERYRKQLEESIRYFGVRWC